MWTISYGGVITAGLNSNQITVEWQTAGSRSISVNYQNNVGCPSSIPTVYAVTVLSVPVPIISGEDSLCSGTTGVVYTTQLNYNNYLWAVSPGGNITSGAGTNSITVDWNGFGNQTVSVEYTNDLGCQSISPTVYNVNVSPIPAASGPVIGSGSVCAGSSAVVYSVAPITFASSYEWTVPVGATIVSGAGTSSIIVDFAINASSGIIKVFGVNDCGSGIVSPNFSIQVNPIPSTPVISQYGDTLVSSSSVGNQWYLDGVAIPGATGQKHIAVYIGTYEVVVTQNGCSSAPSNSILVLPVSTREIAKTSSFDIYPNPSNDIFNLKFENVQNETFNIEVFNNFGTLVWKQVGAFVDGLSDIKIDLNEFPAGVYTVTIRNKSIFATKKVILLH